MNVALAVFNEARKRKALKGQEADISQWITKGWEDFKGFVAGLGDRTTKTQQRKKDKSNVIVHRDDDEVLILTPLSKADSCYCGKATKWCTAATIGENQFTSYINDGVVLFYVLASTGEKWAAAWSPKLGKWEAFDAENNDISLSDIPYDVKQYATGEVAESVMQVREEWYGRIRRGEVKDLGDANLRGADLIGANLVGANLKGANLEGATMPKGWEKVIIGIPAVYPDGKGFEQSKDKHYLVNTTQ